MGRADRSCGLAQGLAAGDELQRGRDLALRE
jgi:hypothetical protein